MKDRKRDEFAAKIAKNTNNDEGVEVEEPITGVEVLVQETESRPEDLKELLPITQEST